MGSSSFLLSTGRCSTQSITTQLQKEDLGLIVEHEPIKWKYRPRDVFRNIDECDRVISEVPEVRQQIELIDHVIERGDRYVSTGWPAFAWAEYFEDRWKEKASFVALTRNPLDFMASMLTHGFFTDRDDGFQSHAIIHATDKHAYYKKFKDSYKYFTPAEKCLIHWMEVNKYIVDFCQKREAQIFRYEEIYGGQQGRLSKFYSALAGKRVTVPHSKYVDNYHRVLEAGISLNDRDLLRECSKLATRLGYDPVALLERARDPSRLRKRYSSRRFGPKAGQRQSVSLRRLRGVKARLLRTVRRLVAR